MNIVLDKFKRSGTSGIFFLDRIGKPTTFDLLYTALGVAVHETSVAFGMMNTLCPNVIKSVYGFPYQSKLAITADSGKSNIFCSGCGFKGHERDSCRFKKHPDYNAQGVSYPASALIINITQYDSVTCMIR